MAERRLLVDHPGVQRGVGPSGNHSDREVRRGETPTISENTDPAVGEPDGLNATIVPLRVRGIADRPTPHFRHPRKAETLTAGLDAPDGAAPIARITGRRRAKVAGRVRSIRVQSWSRIPTLELTIVDTAGDTLIAVFIERRQTAGTNPRTHLSVEAVIASGSGVLSMLNPNYEILVGAPIRE
jgi:hypothetical protein